jgi:hypothetical protein
MARLRVKDFDKHATFVIDYLDTVDRSLLNGKLFCGSEN